jgi:hypothetical protein
VCCLKIKQSQICRSRAQSIISDVVAVINHDFESVSLLAAFVYAFLSMNESKINFLAYNYV